MSWQTRSGSLRRARFSGRVCLSLLLFTLIAGCESNAPKLGKWEGPPLLSDTSLETWTFRGEPAR
ncbi:MAG TPA: hypothetical protein VK986_19300, partial [Tepidisphaeraceae bacterium]|nr:hypothetical protein [Tepidisphaeraceae bacterium]